MPRLTRHPGYPVYIDIKNHPLTLELIANFKAIQIEFDSNREGNAFKKPNFKFSLKDQREVINSFYDGDMTNVTLKIKDELLSDDEKIIAFGKNDELKEMRLNRFQQRRKQFPVLDSILQKYEESIGSIVFNIMTPNARLNPHFGVSEKYIRVHLGIHCNEKATFICADLPPRAWKDGHVWAFSDYETLHYSVNDSNEERVILVIDLLKTALTEIREEQLGLN